MTFTLKSYSFYATLLDAFEGYINSDKTYQAYWGFAENPSKTEDEFKKEQFQQLIDKINRVPFVPNELAMKGTAFNEVVDCIIEHRTSNKMTIKSYPDANEIAVQFDAFYYTFPMDICIKMAKMYSGAVTQLYTQGILNTRYGEVKVYGYIDELMPFKVVDIKTTKMYSSFKFKNNWQRIVYPFCLNQNNIFVNEFEFSITDFKEIWIESYVYDREQDVLKLKKHCEGFIEFLQENQHLITDTKIYGN